MIREIAIDLQSELRAKGCPLDVIVGPEPTKTTTGGRERIVIERDGQERFSPVRGTHVNPKHRRTRAVSAKITIYAQSARTGAFPFEHQRRAEGVLDMVLVAMDRVAAGRHDHWEPTSGHFIVPDDLAKSEIQGGAAYELAFTFDRAVMDRTWAGAGLGEVTLGEGGIRSVTRVSSGRARDDDEDELPAEAETACGA